VLERHLRENVHDQNQNPFSPQKKNIEDKLYYGRNLFVKNDFKIGIK